MSREVVMRTAVKATADIMKMMKSIHHEPALFSINQCHVCEITARDQDLKRCSSCFRISYCSPEHQKIHWNVHKEFCKVLKQLENLVPGSKFDLKKSAYWRNYRKKFRDSCQDLLKRPLNTYEQMMVFHPGYCETCKSKNGLIVCKACLSANYCSEEHKNLDSNNHAKLCSKLKLMMDISLYLKDWTQPNYSLRKGTLTLHENMEEFLTHSIEIPSVSPDSRILEMALLSNLVTHSMSLIYALKWLNYEVKKSLVIHVVGSSYVETKEFMQWEIIPHIYKNIKKLVIEFIGPEVEEPKNKNLCKNCKWIISIGFSKQFYHDYVKNDEYQKPDITCVFNGSFESCSTWEPSLGLLVENGPLITTALADHEANKDIEAVRNAVPGVVVQKILNPFSSISIIQRCWYDQLAYENHFLMVFSKN